MSMQKTAAPTTLALIPLAWGEEALEAALAAQQSMVAANGGHCEVILLGAEGQATACERAAQAGATRVWQAIHADLAGNDDMAALAMAASQALRQSLTETGALTLVLLPPGVAGEELAARLAHQLNGHALGRCAGLRWQDNALVVERITWGGRMRLSLRVKSGLCFACLRSGRANFASSEPAQVTHTALDGALPALMALDRRPTGQRLPALEGAKLVVSGGRGVNERGFELLETLALALGGTLGGSLPAVDAGMVPVMRQVGVSGKFVSPAIYLAVGISGTPQHLAGISPQTRIVAINTDAQADIFNVADVGVIADWKHLLPELLRVIEAQALI